MAKSQGRMRWGWALEIVALGSVALLLGAMAASCEGAGEEPADGEVAGPPDLETSGCGVGVLARGLVSPRELTLAGDRVIVATRPFADNDPLLPGMGDIVSVALDGSGTTMLAAAQGHVRSLANDGTTIYFSTIGQPMRQLPVGGGAVTSVPGVTDPGMFLEVVDGRLYFHSWFDWPQTNVIPHIRVLDPSTGTVDTLVTGDNGVWPHDFTTNGVDLFYMREIEGMPSVSEIVRHDIASGTEKILVSEPYLVLVDLALAADRFLYVTLHGSGPQVGVIHDHVLGSDRHEQVMRAEDFARYVALSETSNYWSGGSNDAQTRNIHRYDRRTSVTEVIPVRSEFVQLIACPGGICWTSPDEGTVNRYVECAP